MEMNPDTWARAGSWKAVFANVKCPSSLAFPVDG